MTQIRDNFFAVEVPEGSEKFRIMTFSKPNTLSYDYSIVKGERITKGLIAMIDLPPGTWQIICTSKEATDIEAEMIVGRYGNFFIDYEMTEQDYKEQDVNWFRSAKNSFVSLLASKGLTGKNYLIIQKL